MNIETVTVGYSKLVSCDHNNESFSVSLTAKLRDGDGYERVRDRLLTECVEYVENKHSKRDLVVIPKEELDKLRKIVKTMKEIECEELPF